MFKGLASTFGNISIKEIESFRRIPVLFLIGEISRKLSSLDGNTAMSNENELNAELQGIKSALEELKSEHDKGMIDIGRYLRLKAEYEARKAKLEELDNLARRQRVITATPSERLREIERLRAELKTVEGSVKGKPHGALQTPSCIRLRLESAADKPPLIESHDRLITIGRGGKNTMQLSDQEVSWEHGHIILKQGEYYYCHLSNSNPTVLRRKGQEYLLRPGKNEERVLRDQDRLTVGKSTFIVEFDLVSEDRGYTTTSKRLEDKDDE